MGRRIRKAVYWQDAPIVREQNHGTHRTHGKMTYRWEDSFPCVRCIPWLRKTG